MTRQDNNGSMAMSLGLVLLSTLLSPVTTPVALHSVGLMAKGSYATTLHALAAQGTSMFLAVCVVVPSCLGVFVRLVAGSVSTLLVRRPVSGEREAINRERQSLVKTAGEGKLY